MTDQTLTPPSTARLLLVDDLASNVEVLVGHLAPLGYHLLVASSGDRALNIAQRSRPDLVLLDVVMPGMDGFEVCRRMKADANLAPIPIIFVTGRSEEAAEGFAAGGVDYIAKPVRADELTARVATHLKLASLVSELETSNEELSRARDHLTEVVLERTQELREANALLVQREASATRLARFYAALSRSTQMMTREDDAMTLYSETCRICVQSGHAVTAAICAPSDGSLTVLASAGSTSVSRSEADRWNSVPAFATLREGALSVCNDIAKDTLFEGVREQARRHGVLAAAAFPIMRAHRVVAVLSLCGDQLGYFDEPLVSLLNEMARNLSYALDNIDRERLRTLAEHEAKVGHDSFRRVFAATPAPAALRSLETDAIVEINTAACKLYGFERPELVGRKWAELGIGLDDADQARLTAQLSLTGSVKNFEAPVRVRSGAARDVLLNADLVEFAGSRCVLTILTDITQRAQMERDLRESQSQLFNVVEAVGDAIVVVDASQRVRMFNRAASSLFGVPVTEAVGSSLDRFLGTASGTGSIDAARLEGASTCLGLGARDERFEIKLNAFQSGEGAGRLTTILIRT